MSILVYRKDEYNGIVYNAKGDLIAGLAGSTATVTSGFGDATASVIFVNNGSINSSGLADAWVETGPTPPAWIGASNYEMSWGAPVVESGTGLYGTSPSSASGYVPMTTSRTFTISKTDPGILTISTTATVTWSVTIRNIATGDTALWSVSCSCTHLGSGGGGGGGV